MKILVVSQYYYPENFRINDICEDLVKRGHQVTVLTGLPNYPEGIVPEAYRMGKRRDEMINGVHVLRCFEIPRHTGSLWRILNYLSFMVSGNLKAEKLDVNGFDVIYGYALSPILQMRAALTYKKRSGKKLLFYCCDIWPEVLKGVLPESSFAFKWAKKVSREIYEGSDVIQVTSKPFINYIHQEHNIPLGKLEYLPQHAEDAYLSMDLSAEENRITDFLFAGNIGSVQALDCIVRAAALLKKNISERWKVHIVGDGSCLETTKRLVHQNGLDDFFAFYGRYPLAEMPRFYRLADVCLLTLKGDTAVGLTIPSKLQGYMAAAKPVVGAINGAAKEIIEESHCGLCVAASDDAGLAKAMEECVLHGDTIKDYGINGRNYFRTHFTKAIFMDALEQKLKDMC